MPCAFIVALLFSGCGEPDIVSAHLTIAAYPDEAPVASAGVPVTGWEFLEPASAELPSNAVGKVWVADMPEGLGRFFSLYDHNGRLNRARAKGFLPTEPGDRTTLHFPIGRLKNGEGRSSIFQSEIKLLSMKEELILPFPGQIRS